MQPYFHYRVGYYGLALFNLYKFFLYQGAFYYADVRRRAELVFTQHFLRGELAVYAVGYGAEEVQLVGSKAFGLLFEKRRVLVNDVLEGVFKVFRVASLPVRVQTSHASCCTYDE